MVRSLLLRIGNRRRPLLRRKRLVGFGKFFGVGRIEIRQLLDELGLFFGGGCGSQFRHDLIALGLVLLRQVVHGLLVICRCLLAVGVPTRLRRDDTPKRLTAFIGNLL